VLDRLLTVEEAADRLGTSARFIRRLILERRIAYTKLGRHVRIAPGDLDAFIRAGRVEVGAPLPGRSKKGRLMAHITRRQRNGKVRYLARYTDPSGRERAKSFTRKKDAERFLTGIENDKLRGTWTDPTLGRVQLADWYALWRRATVELRPNTEARDEAGIGCVHCASRLPALRQGPGRCRRCRHDRAEPLSSGAPSEDRASGDALSDPG
jgi:excisionase family DNA binding protein